MLQYELVTELPKVLDPPEPARCSRSAVPNSECQAEIGQGGW